MRKKRKAPTFAQNITCAFCGKTAKKRQNNQKFCTEECRLANVRVKKIERKCEVCNETYFVAKQSSATRTCGKFCGDVLNAVEQQTYSDEEIIHLALLNAGYGIIRFEEKVTGLSHHNGGRLFWIRNLHLEETGIDLFKILSDSTKLIEMNRGEWLSKGKPARVPNVGNPSNASRMNRKTAKIRYENEKKYGFDVHAPRSHKKVRVYPEFNWGPYKGRQ